VKDGFESPIAKFFPEQVMRKMAERVGAENGEMILFVADSGARGERCAEPVRLTSANVWISSTRLSVRLGIHFPLLEWDDEEDVLSPCIISLRTCDTDIERLMQIAEADFAEEDCAADTVMCLGLSGQKHMLLS
jgi:aspartyl-tRNA synthetase